jgi:hypothetical protein
MSCSKALTSCSLREHPISSRNDCSAIDGRYAGTLRRINLALREHGYRLKNAQVYDVYDVNSPYHAHHALDKFDYERANRYHSACGWSHGLR